MKVVGKMSIYQSGRVYSIDEDSPAVCWRDFKEPAKIVIEDAQILTQKRSELGKKIRKEYEKGTVKRTWREMTDLEPKEERTSNTITGVTKDNMVVITTRRYPCDNKDGYIEVREGDGVVTGRPYACGRSAQSQQSPTIITAKGGGSGVVVAGDLTDSKVNQDRQVYDADGISPTVITPKGSGSKTKIAWPNGANGTVDAKEGDCVKIYPDPSREFSGSNVREGESNALNTYNGCGAGTPVSDGEKLRIRYLTPRECLRLQAFPDDAIDKLQAVLSKSALYKVAGNSIAVCCLKAIFKGIYIDKTFKKDKQSKIESFF